MLKLKQQTTFATSPSLAIKTIQAQAPPYKGQHL